MSHLPKQYNPAESDIDPLLREFYGEFPDATNHEHVVEALRKKLSAELSFPIVPYYTMWLHEYELYRGRDQYARELEENLELYYRQRFSRHGASLLPAPPDANQLLHFPDLKNRFAGQRAFILGNGSSLNQANLNLLRNEITFGMNYIFLKFGKMDFQPTFYCVEDRLIASNRPERIVLQSDSVKLFADTLKPWLGTDSETILFNFILTPSDIPGFPHFSVAADMRLWSGWTTSYTCLQIAYYLGFSTIYLIGFDHNHAIPPDSAVVANRVIPAKAANDVNHFDPDYITPGGTWFLGNRAVMTKAYNKALHAYSIAGRSIYNATQGGCLEVFERRDYETSIASGHPAMCDRTLGVEWVNKWRRQAGKTLSCVRAPGFASSIDLSLILCDSGDTSFLHRTLASAVNQTHANLEIVVLPSGANEFSAEIVEHYRREDPRIRLVPQTGSTNGALLNTGLNAARGEYVLFLDSSAAIREDTAELLLHAAGKGSSDIVVCDAVETTPDCFSDAVNRINPFAIPAEGARVLLRDGIAAASYGCMFRRSLFTDYDIAFPDLQRADMAIFYKLFLVARNSDALFAGCFQESAKPQFCDELTPAKIADVFCAFDMRREHLRSRPDWWTMFRTDYYAGLWRSIDILAERIAAKRASDLEGRLAKQLIVNVVERGLYCRECVSAIDDNGMKERVRSYFGEILYPPPGASSSI